MKDSYGRSGDGEIDSFLYMELEHIFKTFYSNLKTDVLVSLNSGAIVDLKSYLQTASFMQYLDFVMINLPNR